MSAPNESAVGAKVSVRLHDPSGGYRDLLGILETPTSVRKKDGSLHPFDPAAVAIWKVIPPQTPRAGRGAPLSIRIAELDEVAEHTWPALELFDINGWRYRVSNGFTRRANSVRPLGSPPFGLLQGDIETHLQEMVEHFRSRGLTPTFSLSLPIYAALDEYLGEKGWAQDVYSRVMVADRKDLPNSLIQVGEYHSYDFPTQEWLAVQANFRGEEIMRRYPGRYGEVRISGAIAAIGRVAEWNGWAIFTRIFVQPEFRGRGIARELMMQLAGEVMAPRLMLQVESKNVPAIGLYQSLNFKMHNDYSYRMLRS